MHFFLEFVHFFSFFVFSGRLLPVLKCSLTAPGAGGLGLLTQHHGVKVVTSVSVEKCCQLLSCSKGGGSISNVPPFISDDISKQALSRYRKLVSKTFQLDANLLY